MKISIWSGFSSNHSSSFTVVGEFASVLDAQVATDELRRIIQSIADWYKAHPEAEERWNSEGTSPATPPELALLEKYGNAVSIDPNVGLDWIGSYAKAEEHVRQVDRYVILSHLGDTWNGAHPFDQITALLGGKAMVNGDFDSFGDKAERSGSVWLDWLTCDAPTPEIAQAMIDGFQDYMRLDREWWSNAARGIHSQLIAPPWQSMDVLPSAFEERGSGKTLAIGNAIRLERWGFRRLVRGFPALIQYLEKQGCTNIKFEFGFALDEYE